MLGIKGSKEVGLSEVGMMWEMQNRMKEQNKEKEDRFAQQRVILSGWTAGHLQGSR